MKISFEDFKLNIENEIQKFNAEDHKVCNNMYTLELKAVYKTNEYEEHIAVLYYRWKEVEEKFHRNRTYYVINHDYHNQHPDFKSYSLWFRGETIFTTNKVSAIIKKFFIRK